MKQTDEKGNPLTYWGGLKDAKKQTAVEWLEDCFNRYGAVLKSDFIKAKEMEKEQQQETFKQSRLAKIFEKDMPPIWENFEQYYNETFKQKP
jgi:hypothetical protein